MKEKIINIIEKVPEFIPKYVYINARNRKINLKINEAIKKHKEKYKKIEMHESIDCKPYIRK